ncbi:MAG: ATP-binding cassette domain-containing protein [Candidatus Bathyarchaeia archaeon]
MDQPLLELRNASREFKVGGGLGLFSRRIIKAVDAVSFSMPSKPWITALIGESGSGKTTIARMILGLLPPTSGEILYKGRKVSEWIKKNKMEYYREVQPIFQDPYSIYNPFYRVDRVLEVTIKKFKLASSKKEMRDLMIKAMEDIGLRPEDLLGRYPHQLSGGERQRFMLTRILLIKPRLIVADEPISMIDVSLRAIFLDHLLSFKEKHGISCLYISHDLHTASYLADNVIILCYGRIVEEGPKNQVIEDPLHPYTKLLISSIPIPDPKRRWTDKIDLTSMESLKKFRADKGCVFSARCPYVMEKCLSETPQLKSISQETKVACHLYYSEK